MLIFVQTLIQSIYILIGKIFFVNDYKKIKNDVEYNFTEITESSWRSFRNEVLNYGGRARR